MASFSAYILFASLFVAIEASSRVVWVVESETYTNSLRTALNGSKEWSLQWCGANGSLCTQGDPQVAAVVGMADAVNLSSLANLLLVQSASNYYTALPDVPPSGIYPCKL